MQSDIWTATDLCSTVLSALTGSPASQAEKKSPHCFLSCLSQCFLPFGRCQGLNFQYMLCLCTFQQVPPWLELLRIFITPLLSWIRPEAWQVSVVRMWPLVRMWPVTGLLCFNLHHMRKKIILQVPCPSCDLRWQCWELQVPWILPWASWRQEGWKTWEHEPLQG